MEHEEALELREKIKPTLEEGRSFFGKENYDSHIKDILQHFGYNINDNTIKIIFDI